MTLVAIALIGIGVTWLLWHSVRDIRFVIDLDRMAGELFDEAYRRGKLSDPAFKEVAALVRTTAECRRLLSAPILIREMFWDRTETNLPSSPDVDFNEWLNGFVARYVLRVLRYILVETALGLPIWMLTFLAPRKGGAPSPPAARAALATIYHRSHTRLA